MQEGQFVPVGECEKRFHGIMGKLEAIIEDVREIKEEVKAFGEMWRSLRMDVNDQKVKIALLVKDVESLQRFSDDVKQEERIELGAYQNAKWYFIFALIMFLISTVMQVIVWTGRNT